MEEKKVAKTGVLRSQRAGYSFLGALLIAGAMLACLALRPTKGGTSADDGIESQTFDFGKVRSGGTLVHTFSILNNSKDTLKIARIKPSCSCTVVGSFTDLIKPGGSAAIPLQVRLPEDTTESFESHVVVEIDRLQPFELRLTADVVQQNPKALDFGSIRSGSTPERIFVIHSVGSRAIEVKGSHFDVAYFAVESRPWPENTRDAEVTVKLRPDIPRGPFTAQIAIETSDDASPVKHVDVDGYVLQDVEIDGAPVTIPSVSISRPGSATIRVYSPYGDRVSVTRVTATPAEFVSANFGAIRYDDAAVNIPITVKAGFQNEVLKGTVTLTAKAGSLSRDLSVDVYAAREEAVLGAGQP
jgi:hypothetical protein